MRDIPVQIGDIVGNTVQGFDFKVLKIDFPYLLVKNTKNGEEFKTFYYNMYLPQK